jgi:hypothetical protein
MLRVGKLMEQPRRRIEVSNWESRFSNKENKIINRENKIINKEKIFFNREILKVNKEIWFSSKEVPGHSLTNRSVKGLRDGPFFLMKIIPTRLENE